MKNDATPTVIRWTPFSPRAGCKSETTTKVRFTVCVEAVSPEMGHNVVFDTIELDGIESDIERWFVNWLQLATKHFGTNRIMPETAIWKRLS